ncbi:MAG TPA: hypothetical protein PLP42_14435 [Acidobacteriota bacterium]|nr:hypothetical protein [Acidobacteriota bacterium]
MTLSRLTSPVALIVFFQMLVSANSSLPLLNGDPGYIALRTVRLSGAQAFAENVVLNREIATITLKKGTLHFLAPVEGRVTGAVFVGEGEVQIEPTAPSEKANLAKLTKSATLTDTFDRLVLRFTDGAYTELTKDSTVREGPVDARAQSALDDFRKLLRRARAYSEPNMAVVFVRLNFDGRLLMDLKRNVEEKDGLFLAYFNGKQYGDMLFSVDPLGQPYTRPEQVVLVNLSEKNLGIWVSEHLKATPSSMSGKKDSRLIDAETYVIEATAKGSTLSAKVTLDFKGLVDGVSVLSFDLYPTLRVGKVTDQAGRELSFIQEDKDEDPDFFVLLEEPIKAGQGYQLNFEYEGKDAVHDSGGGNYTLIPRSSWYPNNPFGPDRAIFEMTFKVPKGLTMVATGELQEGAEKGIGR